MEQVLQYAAPDSLSPFVIFFTHSINIYLLQQSPPEPRLETDRKAAVTYLAYRQKYLGRDLKFAIS